MPVPMLAARPALASMGPGETADYTFVPTQPGRMMLEVWYPTGTRIVLPVEVQARSMAAKN